MDAVAEPLAIRDTSTENADVGILVKPDPSPTNEPV